MKTSKRQIRLRYLSIFLVVALVAVPTITALALTDILSANENYWDVYDITDIDNGSIEDGGQDAFDGFGTISTYVEDGSGGWLSEEFDVSGFGLSLDVTGRRFATTTPVTQSSVSISRDLYAPSGTNYIRYIDTFTNTSAAVRRVWVVWGGNLGSDSWTTIAATSSGDLNITTADTWAVTIQEEFSNPAGPAGDPPVGYALGLEGNPAYDDVVRYGSSYPYVAWVGNGNDNLGYQYYFELAPGETVKLAYFLYHGISEVDPPPAAPADPPPAAGSEIALAQTVLTNILDNPDSYFSDLNLNDQALIINWNLLSVTSTSLTPVMTSGPSSLTVMFSKDVKHDGSVGAANNVANYRLFEDGVNNVFNTANCLGGVSADDTNIVINSATYNAATFTATLNINSGVPLPAGTYRLLICGTTSIEDLAGNKLNGGLADAIVNFTVAAAPDAPAALPSTGFAPDRMTVLPVQPANKAYTAMGDLWLEIPKLGVQMNIVGVPQANGEWDVSWLGSDAGWLNGSAFPTWAGNSVLTGHVWNADNTAGPFRYINTLWWGDKVIVHAWGAQYVYEVRSVSQVGPGSTGAMMKHEKLPWVTLVTCRGYDAASNSYKYRVLVRAVLVEVK